MTDLVVITVVDKKVLNLKKFQGKKFLGESELRITRDVTGESLLETIEEYRSEPLPPPEDFIPLWMAPIWQH